MFHPITWEAGLLFLLSALLCVLRTGFPALISSRASPSSLLCFLVTSPRRHPSKMHQAPSFALI